MACHDFTHKILYYNKYLWHNVSTAWNVWNEPHLSSLTNVENPTSNFHQSVQICCREEQGEENNGNCQTFCITHKCKKCEIAKEKVLYFYGVNQVHFCF